MNYLVLEIQDREVHFRGGYLDGRQFIRGEMAYISEEKISFRCSEPFGTWCLQSTIHRGRPAVVCLFFNKRSRRMKERYLYTFKQDGVYLCGPRFSKRVAKETAEMKIHLREAA